MGDSGYIAFETPILYLVVYYNNMLGTCLKKACHFLIN